MATSYTTGVLFQTDDAWFRAWGSAFSAQMAAVGMVKTADTGQIDWATVLRPTVANTSAGYEIWRFNDALQATSPIYIKIEYGCSANTGVPAMWVTVANATNGAGSLVAPWNTPRTAVSFTGTQAGGTLGRYFCHTAGHFGCAFHDTGASGGAHIAFMVTRFCNDDGTPNGDGFILFNRFANGASYPLPMCVAVRTAFPQVVYPQAQGTYTLIPQGITDSHVGNQVQMFLHWTPTPRIKPVFAHFTYMTSELGRGAPISAAVVGASPRTYIPMGSAFGSAVNGTAGYSTAMLWE